MERKIEFPLPSYWEVLKRLDKDELDAKIVQKIVACRPKQENEHVARATAWCFVEQCLIILSSQRKNPTLSFETDVVEKVLTYWDNVFGPRERKLSIMSSLSLEDAAAVRKLNSKIVHGTIPGLSLAQLEAILKVEACAAEYSWNEFPAKEPVIQPAMLYGGKSYPFAMSFADPKTWPGKK